MRTVAIIGASLAGLRSAQELRAQGFDGRITLIGAERHRPYDRPPLSKDFLTGQVCRDSLALAEEADDDELAVDWRLGTRATGLDTASTRVTLADGTQVAADGVVIATGGTARALPGSEGVGGVHTLRTLDDAVALRHDLAAGGRLVVIGGGFIGSEIAATARALGCEVTVVEAMPVPLAAVLGPQLGSACARLHPDHGVTLRCGVGVASLTSAGHPQRVTGVRLDDRSWLRADVVVTGIGMRPATDWLSGSGIAVADGVRCDAGGATALPSVVAVGDVARYQDPATGRSNRSEHWTDAVEQPAVAVRNLLAGSTVAQHAPRGYFWSEQYGVRIQFTGTTEGHDEVEIVEGSPAEHRFLAVYRREAVTIGALAMNHPKLFTRVRRRLAADELAPAP